MALKDYSDSSEAVRSRGQDLVSTVILFLYNILCAGSFRAKLLMSLCFLFLLCIYLVPSRGEVTFKLNLLCFLFSLFLHILC